MKLKRFEAALIAAVIFTFFFGFVFDCSLEAKALSEKLVRLHVVANSDTDADQALKLKVRDAVLDVLRGKLAGVSDAAAARDIIEESFEELKAASREVIEGEGYDYDVSVSLCREAFPTTEYDNFSLPAGEYESLRIKIGKAEGHNWWCVVFPPVCDQPFINTDSAAALGLTGGEVNLITHANRGYVVRFKTIEIINKFFDLFR